jgi:hypothetical protein
MPPEEIEAIYRDPISLGGSSGLRRGCPSLSRHRHESRRGSKPATERTVRGWREDVAADVGRHSRAAQTFDELGKEPSIKSATEYSFVPGCTYMFGKAFLSMMKPDTGESISISLLTQPGVTKASRRNGSTT